MSDVVPGYEGDQVAAELAYTNVLAECVERGRCVGCGAYWLPTPLGGWWTAVCEHAEDCERSEFVSSTSVVGGGGYDGQ